MSQISLFKKKFPSVLFTPFWLTNWSIQVLLIFTASCSTLPMLSDFFVQIFIKWNLIGFPYIFEPDDFKSHWPAYIGCMCGVGEEGQHRAGSCGMTQPFGQQGLNQAVPPEGLWVVQVK